MPGNPPGPNGDMAGAAAAIAMTAAAEVTGSFGVVEEGGFDEELEWPLLLLPRFMDPPDWEIMELTTKSITNQFDNIIHNL